MKTGSGTRLDMGSLKALVVPPVNKPMDLERTAREASAKLLPEAHRKRGSSFRQVFVALLANLSTVNTGMVFGFSAVAIPQLLAKDSIIPINKDQESWIASLSAITTPIGCILSGYLMDLIGRKKVIMFTQIPTLIGWILTGYATSVEMIYAGRLLVGFGSGMVGAPARVYTAETTQPHLRGMLAAIASVGVSLGVLIEYSLGTFCSWQMIALFSSIIPAVALISSFLLPESPQWLISIGKEEECKKSLSKLRGKTCDIDYEAGLMIAFAQQNNIHKPTVKETLRGILQPAALKPFFVLCLYFLIYQMSGVNPVTFYAIEVIQSSGATINKYLALILMGVIRLVFTVVSAVLMRKCGRRPLTFFSSVGCGISMLILGGYTYMGMIWEAEKVEPQYTWVPVVAIFTFTITSVIGFLVVPWVMIGEVYPTQVRGVIGGMTTCAGHFFIFVAVKTFPMLKDMFNAYGAYFVYGFISLLGTVFFYFYLPETKGRTLQEIEDYFSGRRKNLKSNPPSKNPSFIQAPKGQVLP